MASKDEIAELVAEARAVATDCDWATDPALVIQLADALEREQRARLAAQARFEHVAETSVERGQRIAVLEAQLAEAKRQLAWYRKELSDMQEREAKCCPEDYGFDEYLAVLTKRIAVLETYLWECPDCGFPNCGEDVPAYSCPICKEANLTARITELEAKLAEAENKSGGPSDLPA